MFKSIPWKLLAIGVLALILLIPLGMVEGMVGQRQSYRSQAINSVSDGAAGRQRLSGPIWTLPYKQKYIEVVDDKTGKTREVWRDERVQLLPEKLVVQGQLDTRTKVRGIYTVKLYTADLKISGEFVLPERAGLGAKPIIEWGVPYLSVGILDVRGIKASPVLNWGGGETSFQPGAQLGQLGEGIHAPLVSYNEHATTVPFSFKLKLDGMDEFFMLPVGRDTEVELKSSWPDPSFAGRFLPDSSVVNAGGFDGKWTTSWFASNMKEKFDSCIAGKCDEFQNSQLGVRLIEAVDVYLQTDRAVKYGFLFIFLTFCTFLLTEVLKRIAIHPVQYGLVGLSLAVFFLLLLSLAEQLSFPVAYVLAGGACVLQNGFYASHALGSRARGLGFAGLLGGLYGLLYLLLCSEDYALLLGSLLVFAVLMVVMVLTRKVNWYGLNGKPAVAAVSIAPDQLV